MTSLGSAAHKADDEVDGISTTQIDPNHQKQVYDHSDAVPLAAAEHEDDLTVQGVSEAIPSEWSRDHLTSSCSPPLADVSTNTHGTEAYCRTSADDDDERFQDWLNGGPAQGTETSSKETLQLLSEDGNASDTNHEQPAKRQRLSQVESPGALLKMSCDHELHTTLVGKSVVSDDESCRSESCHLCDQDCANGDEGQMATEATALRAKPSVHLQAASPGVISPPASMPSDVASASERAGNPAIEQLQLPRPPRRHSSSIQDEACRSRSVTETKALRQTDSCSSCVIFRAALLEALSLLQCQSPVGNRNESWQDNLVQDASQRHSSKRTISGQRKSIATVDRLPHADENCGASSTESSGTEKGQFKTENTRRRNNRWSQSKLARYRREDACRLDHAGFTYLTDDDSVASDSSVEVASRGLSSDQPTSEHHTPKQARQGQLLKDKGERRKMRQSKSRAAPSQSNGTRNVNRPYLADVSYDKSINGACSGGEDDGSDYSSVGDASGAGTKRRRWVDLEVCRLRAWKREGKSESWIAARLNRTESAVKQQWRKMTER